MSPSNPSMEEKVRVMIPEGAEESSRTMVPLQPMQVKQQGTNQPGAQATQHPQDNGGCQRSSTANPGVKINSQRNHHQRCDQTTQDGEEVTGDGRQLHFAQVENESDNQGH